MDLKEAREIINSVDSQMAKLFEQRMTAVFEVAKYKKENNMPIYDPEREKIVIEKNSKYIENPEYIEYYKKWIQYTMDLSKEYQKTKI